MRALELGCGNGRNANYLSINGFDVNAVDFSHSSIAMAKKAATEIKSTVRFYCQSIFDFKFDASSYDFMYDSGCLHHIAPHRRPTYLDLINKALRPGGIFGLVCFAPGGGCDYSDFQVYENRTLLGGLSYTEDSIHRIFSKWFDILSFRKMKEQPDDTGLFGKDFLWSISMKNGIVESSKK